MNALPCGCSWTWTDLVLCPDHAASPETAEEHLKNALSVLQLATKGHLTSQRAIESAAVRILRALKAPVVVHVD
jgi:hypothetical protein